MTPWAALGEAIALTRELYRDWKTGQPKRDRAKQDSDYARDVERNAQAAATGDAATLTLDFEAERQAAIRRGDLGPAPPAGERPEARGNGR